MAVLYEARFLFLFGFLQTIKLFVLSAALALAVAFVLGTARVFGSRYVSLTAALTAEFFRGVSTLVVLFWLYFALPFLGLSLSAEVAAVIGLGLVHGAYSSEVVRGALQSIGHDQWEAASALGLSRWRTIMLVIWPQAAASMVPPLGNAMVVLLKGTSLASVITVHELTFQGQLIVTRTLATFTVFTAILLIYYLASLVIIASFKRLEARLTTWRPRATVR